MTAGDLNIHTKLVVNQGLSDIFETYWVSHKAVR